MQGGRLGACRETRSSEASPERTFQERKTHRSRLLLLDLLWFVVQITITLHDLLRFFLQVTITVRDLLWFVLTSRNFL